MAYTHLDFDPRPTTRIAWMRGNGVDFDPVNGVTLSPPAGERIHIPYIYVQFTAPIGHTLVVFVRGTGNDLAPNGQEFTLTATTPHRMAYRIPGPFDIDENGYISLWTPFVDAADDVYLAIPHVSYAFRGDFKWADVPLIDGQVAIHGITDVLVQLERAKIIQDCDAVLEWAELANTDNLDTSLVHVQGTGALQFDKIAGGQTCGIESTIPAVDISRFAMHDLINLCLYMPALTNVVSVQLLVGTDDANYNYWQWTVSQLVVGWNFLTSPVYRSTTVGNGWDPSLITYVQLQVTFAAPGNVLADMLLDAIAIMNADALTSIGAHDAPAPLVATQTGRQAFALSGTSPTAVAAGDLVRLVASLQGIALNTLVDYEGKASPITSLLNALRSVTTNPDALRMEIPVDVFNEINLAVGTYLRMVPMDDGCDLFSAQTIVTVTGLTVVTVTMWETNLSTADESATTGWNQNPVYGTKVAQVGPPALTIDDMFKYGGPITVRAILFSVVVSGAATNSIKISVAKRKN